MRPASSAGSPGTASGPHQHDPLPCNGVFSEPEMELLVRIGLLIDSGKEIKAPVVVQTNELAGWIRFGEECASGVKPVIAAIDNS